MKIFLLILVVVGCFFAYRWQTTKPQPLPEVAVVATPVPATPTPVPKKPVQPTDMSTVKKGTAGKPQPLTRSAEIQKEMGLKGTSLDQPVKK